MSQVKSLRTGIKFKDTSIGKIPVDWEVQPLSQIAEIIMGQSPPSEECNDHKDGLPFYQGNADFGARYPSTRRWCKKPLKIAKKGDILISVRAPVGEINISPHECCIGRGLGAIRATKMDKDYLYQSMLFHRRALEKVSQGSTFEAINRSALSEFLIFASPLLEQRQIAEILSTVDDSFEETYSIIEKTRQLKKGLMQRLFTRGIGHKKFKKTEIGQIPVEWKVVKLKELYKSPIRDFGSFSMTKLVKYVAEGVPFLRSENFKDGRFVPKNILHITDTVHKELPKSIIKKGDLLFTKIGNIGHADIYNGSLGECNSNATIAKIDIDENEASPHYIRWVLNSRVATKQYDTKIISTPPRINLGEISNLKIPLPIISEQRKVISLLNNLEALILEEEYKRIQLDSLKASLMQVLLTGKIRVKLH